MVHRNIFTSRQFDTLPLNPGLVSRDQMDLISVPATAVRDSLEIRHPRFLSRGLHLGFEGRK